MIYFICNIIFILILFSLTYLLILIRKIKGNKNRIRILEKDLLWNVPKWLVVIYSVIPTIGKGLIKKSKDTLLENQLLNFLGDLSSNLVGGISTFDTIESMIKDQKSPLKNKLSLYIMMSKKHGSIYALEALTNKENNIFMRMFFIMMLNHIKNGGAIADNIKKLQKILFIRTNIRQRIKAQLLQTKIQIIAGTILPYFMFAIMDILYGDMIRAIFRSTIGLAMIGIAVALHLIGVISFIRICKFDMLKELKGSMLFEYISFSLRNGIAIIASMKDAAGSNLIPDDEQIKKCNSTNEIISFLAKVKDPYSKLLSSILSKGYSLGISINEDLSYQAQDILEKLEQKAIRFQQMAPAKALIPMLFCIFPATYLMILAPIVVQVMS